MTLLLRRLGGVCRPLPLCVRVPHILRTRSSSSGAPHLAPRADTLSSSVASQSHSVHTFKATQPLQAGLVAFSARATSAPASSARAVQASKTVVSSARPQKENRGRDNVMWKVQVISAPGPDTDLCLYVEFDNARFLFGAGEGTQRAFVQKRKSMRWLQAIFISGGGLKGRGGLPGESISQTCY